MMSDEGERFVSVGKCQNKVVQEKQQQKQQAKQLKEEQKAERENDVKTKKCSIILSDIWGFSLISNPHLCPNPNIPLH